MTARLLLLNLVLLVVSAAPTYAATLWRVQSVDTMKTSRDLTLYRQDDPSFDEYIDREMQLIQETGANYVTIDGAYDEAYIPWMRRWVASARKHDLKIWYRGNFSAWHGWFGPAGMTREQHLQKTQDFILHHPDLFEDGDAFTPCPECEWGGPGNPIETNDVHGFRKFMIDEYHMMNDAFSVIGKDVYTNWFSMNPDVAKQVLDAETVDAIGNVITLDYFVKDVAQLEEGLDFFTDRFPEASILIGEFGAPIPEINGTFTADEKEAFIRDVFEMLRKRENILGINYWISTRGATELFSKDFKKSTAYDVVSYYYQPGVVEGYVHAGDTPLPGIAIQSNDGPYIVDASGSFRIVRPTGDVTISIHDDRYRTYTHTVSLEKNEALYLPIELTPVNTSFWQTVRDMLYVLGQRVMLP